EAREADQRHGGRPSRLRDPHQPKPPRSLRRSLPVPLALPQASEVTALVQKSLSLLPIVGPTASGKTDLAFELARRLDGELVSADSRQLYKELDAGTAKPKDTGGIPCHLVDIIDPSETMDAARFSKLAEDAIADIRARKKTPILVGGTGFYVKALL